MPNSQRGGNAMATIKDVAKLAGVSISTVSRVTNGSKAVSPLLKVKVEKAIEELNYSPNSLARSLKDTTTKVIAVIITTISRTFFTSVLEGIHKVASKKGYSVIIAETYDSIETEMRLVKTFVDQWVDGIILASSAYDTDKKTLKYINSLHALSKKDVPIPVVTLEFPLDNKHVDAVIIDHERAAFEAVNHLIKSGRREVVHVSIPKNHYMGKKRIEGYCRAMKEAGLPVTEDSIWPGNYTTYSGFEAAEKMILRGKSFDAVFCANDQMAVGVMKACIDHGLRIPEDVAVMGNDDIFPASIVSPSLSSIHVPKVDMGAIATTQLLDQIESGEMRKRRLVTALDFKIIARESTTKKGSRSSLEYLIW